jgi:hypothetical protein
MKLQYMGLAPITNIYGDWQPGEVKEVPEGISMPPEIYEKIEDIQLINKKPEITPQPENIRIKGKRKKKVLKEKLDDRMERDNLVIED